MSEISNQDPMNIGKILDKSISFIFRNVFFIILIGFISALSNFWNVKGPINFVCTTITCFINPLFWGIVSALLGKQFCGDKISSFAGLKHGIKKWIPLLLLTLLSGTACVLGFILFIIPGVIIFCATACACPAMMLEDLGPIDAFFRSWNLTKKSRLRIFGYILLFCVSNMIASKAAIAMTHWMPIDPLYKLGLSALIFAPFGALYPAIFTLIYFDLRLRKEAWDLEQDLLAISVPAGETR